MRVIDSLIAKAENWEHVPLTARQASAVARRFKVKRPKMGYMIGLHNGTEIQLWLSSAGHFQFGTFGLSKDTLPFYMWRAQ